MEHRRLGRREEVSGRPMAALHHMEWRRGKRTLERDSKAVKGMSVVSRRSKVYRLPGCPGYDQVSAKNRGLFVSREAVEAERYRLAGDCR
jgi:hypothetical protein